MAPKPSFGEAIRHLERLIEEKYAEIDALTVAIEALKDEESEESIGDYLKHTKGG